MKLNEDIMNHVYSFLPIMNNSVKELNRSILNLHSTVYLSLINIYYIKLQQRPEYLSWLLNDIEIWMNQDIAVMRGFTSKYLDIVIKTGNIHLSDDLLGINTELSDNDLLPYDDYKSYFIEYWDNLYSDPGSKLEEYIFKLSLIEVVDLYRFIHKMNFKNIKMFSGIG